MNVSKHVRVEDMTGSVDRHPMAVGVSPAFNLVTLHIGEDRIELFLHSDEATDRLADVLASLVTSLRVK